MHGSSDDEGATATATVTITIDGTNDTPNAVPDTAGGTENQSISIDVLANDTDVDGNDNPGNFVLNRLHERRHVSPSFRRIATARVAQVACQPVCAGTGGV